MPFNPNEDQLISLEEASELTANFRAKFPNALLANAYNKHQMIQLPLLPQASALVVKH